MSRFQLRVAAGTGRPTTVTRSGLDGADAAHRYAATHPGTVILACRPAPSTEEGPTP